MYFSSFQITYNRKTKFYLKFQKNFFTKMSNLQRGRILIIINQRGHKKRKPKCMKSPETAIGRIRNGSKRRDTQTKRVLWSFYKKQMKMKRCKKWNTYKPKFKSKKEERNRPFLLNEKEEKIEKIWLVLSLSFLISKSKNNFGFEKKLNAITVLFQWT